MKANCKALKLSIVISSILILLILILVFFVLKTNNKLLEIVLNVSIGIFGSGCVALLMSIPAYNVSKRQLLEKYWQETKRLIEAVSKVDYLFNEYSEELVISYVNELKDKHWKEEFNKISNEKININDQKYKDKLIGEYLTNHPELKKKTSKSSLNNYASECVDTHIEKMRKKAKEIYSQYITISKQSTINLNFMLGDMQFFSGKKPYQKIHTKTYQPLFNIINDINDESFHFKLFLDGEGNEAVVLEKIFDLQHKIFDIEIRENDDLKSYIINNKFINQMLLNLEEFRADMYGIKPEEQQLHPVECRTYYKKNY